MYVSWLKRNLSCFFFFLLSHIISLCLTVKEKFTYFFFAHTHTLNIYLEDSNTLLSPFQLSFLLLSPVHIAFLGYFLEGGNTLLSPLLLSSLCLSLFQVALHGYLLEGGNTLLSPLQLSSLRLSLFIQFSLAIFLQHCLFIRLFSCSLLNQEYITFLTGIRLSFHTKENQINFSFFNQET